ncbi:MAG: hypothetical protein QHH74_10975 [Spirochaetota bacterium]|nr:hypothetical protein [Spirochaetota bacterium]
MTRLEYLINIMDNVEDPDGDHEPSYIQQWPIVRSMVSENESVRQQDIRYIKNGAFFAEWINEEYASIERHNEWYWHIATIVAGQYPLERLPEHVRDIAARLYYGVRA